MSCDVLTGRTIAGRSDFGVVYPQFDFERHVIKPFRLPKDAQHARYRCYDWGFRNPSAMLWATLLPVGFKFPKRAGEVWGGVEIDHEILLVYREYYQREQTPALQAKVIKTLSEGEKYRGHVIADGSIFNRTQVGGQKSMSIADLLKHQDILCRKARGGRGRDDMIAQVAKVQLWFEEDKIIFFETCGNAIYEHQTWRYKNSKNEAERQVGDEVYEKENDHCPDALRYLLQERLTYALPTSEVVAA